MTKFNSQNSGQEDGEGQMTAHRIVCEEYTVKSLLRDAHLWAAAVATILGILFGAYELGLLTIDKRMTAMEIRQQHFEQDVGEIKGQIGRLDVRIDHLDAKVDQLGARLDTKIDQLGVRLDQMEVKMDDAFSRLSAKIDSLASGARAVGELPADAARASPRIAKKPPKRS